MGRARQPDSAVAYPTGRFSGDKLSRFRLFDDFCNLGLDKCLAHKRGSTKQSGEAARLLGYVAIWLLPAVVALTLAMAIRFTLVQPFRIPSGAMQPTLQVGDYIIVTKGTYGYGQYSFAPFAGPHDRVSPHNPQRGDIVVFRPSPDPQRDFVKRVVGLPGDRIQMIDGVLNINGVPVRYEPVGTVDTCFDVDGSSHPVRAYRETLPNGVNYIVCDKDPHGELDNTRAFVVPAGNYFMLGDDRDNSADSRTPVVGYVPFENLIGPVRYVVRHN